MAAGSFDFAQSKSEVIALTDEIQVDPCHRGPDSPLVTRPQNTTQFAASHWREVAANERLSYWSNFD